jgi:hypothetical protein
MKKPSVKDLKLQMIDLIVSLEANLAAYDDDKEGTWEAFKDNWDSLKSNVERHISEIEGHEFSVLVKYKTANHVTTKQGFTSMQAAEEYVSKLKNVHSSNIRKVK